MLMMFIINHMLFVSQSKCNSNHFVQFNKCNTGSSLSWVSTLLGSRDDAVVQEKMWRSIVRYFLPIITIHNARRYYPAVNFKGPLKDHYRVMYNNKWLAFKKVYKFKKVLKVERLVIAKGQIKNLLNFDPAWIVKVRLKRHYLIIHRSKKKNLVCQEIEKKNVVCSESEENEILNLFQLNPRKLLLRYLCTKKNFFLRRCRYWVLTKLGRFWFRKKKGEWVRTFLAKRVRNAKRIWRKDLCEARMVFRRKLFRYTNFFFEKPKNVLSYYLNQYLSFFFFRMLNTVYFWFLFTISMTYQQKIRIKSQLFLTVSSLVPNSILVFSNRETENVNITQLVNRVKKSVLYNSYTLENSRMNYIIIKRKNTIKRRFILLTVLRRREAKGYAVKQ